MSTRCQIEFINEYKKTFDETEKIIRETTKIKSPMIQEKRLVYRHSDGYPDGVIPDLKEFIEWNRSRMNDLEYTTANFIYWSKINSDKQMMEYYKNKNEPIPKNLTGFGICDPEELHGDIEYFYQVIYNKGKIKIKCYNVEWNMKYQDVVKQKSKIYNIKKIKEE